MSEEPLTIENALDVLRSWSWLYDEMRSPQREGETIEDATDRWILEGAALGRNRQCSIGWHDECSDRSGVNHQGRCTCPCHQAEWSRIVTLLQWMDECLSTLVAEGADAPVELAGDDLPYHLRSDATPLAQCSRCGRNTWDANIIGTEDQMPQPDGEPCGGLFTRPG